MKTMKYVTGILALAMAVAIMPGCKKKTATININSSTGDGDVTGKGGSAKDSFTWNNSNTKAEYNMDITASSGGTLRLTVKDADGTTVVSESLTAGAPGDDSKSGCSSAGVAGEWTVELELIDFDGDGSYSLSKGC